MLEKLQATSPGAELWWDALPSAYPVWARRAIAAAPPEQQAALAERLTRFFAPDAPGRSLVAGCTSNPRLVFESLALEPERWAALLTDVAARHPQANSPALFEAFYAALFVQEARLLEPLWASTQGRQGWVCAQTLPAATTHEALVAEGRALAAQAPNLMVKMPASQDGLVALELLAAAGISVNTTWCFSVAQAVASARAIARGRADAPQGPWRAVVTFMAGRLGAEPALREQAEALGIQLSPEEVRWAEVAVLKRIHQRFAEGGWPVTLLVCSLKLDAADDGPSCWHLERSAGARCVYTIAPPLLAGLADPAYDRVLDAGAIAAEVPAAVMARLNRLPYFQAAFEDDGLAADDFADQPAYQRARAEAEAAHRGALAWVEAHHPMRTENLT